MQSNSDPFTCTPIQSARLDTLLASASGACALLAVLALFVYPFVRGRRGWTKRQGPSSGAAAREPLLEVGEQEQQPQPQEQQQRWGQPSRRVKLLVAFSCLTMALGCGRCLLRATRYLTVRFLPGVCGVMMTS